MVLLHSLLLESVANKKYFVVLFNPWPILLGSPFLKIKLELVAQQNQGSNFVICKSESIVFKIFKNEMATQEKRKITVENL